MINRIFYLIVRIHKIKNHLIKLEIKIKIKLDPIIKNNNKYNLTHHKYRTINTNKSSILVNNKINSIGKPLIFLKVMICFTLMARPQQEAVLVLFSL